MANPRRFVLLAVILISTGSLKAADDISAQIRDQAFNHSQVLDHAFYLSDVYGPRFIASPAFQQALHWTTQQFKEMHLKSILERFTASADMRRAGDNRRRRNTVNPSLWPHSGFAGDSPKIVYLCGVPGGSGRAAGSSSVSETLS